MTRYCHRPEQLSDLLQQTSLLRNQPLDILQNLNTALYQLLQTELTDVCRVANIRHGRAIILCRSAAWATRIKMQRAAILDNFRQKILPDLAGIDIEVSPKGHLTSTAIPLPAANERTLSSEAVACLQQAAASATDERLQQALLKLAQRTNQ